MRRTIALVSSGVLSVWAPASPVDQRLLVPTASGIGQWVVANPDAPSCTASMIVCSDKPMLSAIESGYELTNRVVVRTNRVGAFAALGARPAGVPDHLVIETPSVRDAASLARTLRLAPSVERVYVDVEAPKSLRSIPDDPFLELQWNLRNLQDPGIDANVVPVWEAGLSGAGVVVGVVETQNVQFAHPDLEANYNADASLVDRPFHQHTTAVAGIIAMVGNNQGGGAGASYGAQFSTMAVGSATKTAEAFAYRNDLNDIKNNSWGPPDNARIGRITTIEREALAEAVANGRAGLGEVFVWAAGNGGLNPDEREDYDPYASSRYTIAVSSFNDDGRFSEYAERGSSILVCAPSDGGFGSPQNRGIFSTDLVGSPGYDPGDYTDSFGGTSAAAPLAAGVIALLLEARPDLTWRDVQHILVRSARMIDESDAGWEFNGAGRMLHERYGFGAIDAGAALTIAQDWQTIGDERTAASGLITLNQAIPDNDPAGLTQTVEIPESFRVESVELALNIPGTFVGDLDVRITSPAGTETIFAEQRDGDFNDGYIDWIFTSTRHWGEDSAGVWTISVSDRAEGDLHTWQDFELRIFGSDEPFCRADISSTVDPTHPAYDDPDGMLDSADFFRFLDLFASGDMRADLTGSSDPNDPSFGVPDGQITPTDFFFYLDLFALGCP